MLSNRNINNNSNNHSCCRRSSAIVAMVLMCIMMMSVPVADAQNALRRLRRNVLTLDAAATPLRNLFSFQRNDSDLAQMTSTRNDMFESIQHDNEQQQQQGKRKVLVDREIVEMDLLERMLGGSMSM